MLERVWRKGNPSMRWEGKLVWLLWNTVWRFLKKLKIELPCDPVLPLLGIYPDKNIIQRDTCTPVFIAALFTIARTCKQPKCPSADEWIKMRCMYTHTHTHTMEYYSASTKNEMPFVATWIELQILILSEIRQRKPNTIWYHLYVESKICHKWTYRRNRNSLTDIESSLSLPREEGWRRARLGVRD